MNSMMILTFTRFDSLKMNTHVNVWQVEWKRILTIFLVGAAETYFRTETDFSQISKILSS